MQDMQKILSLGKAFVLSRVAARRTSVVLDRPICSFTFDDVEASALITGLPILERSGVKATWYIAGSFVGSNISAGDIASLAAAGQDVQCHTRSHYSLAQGSAAELQQDAADNRHYLKSLVPGLHIEHFSYPFGQVNTAAKRLLIEDYLTLRSIYAGVNHGTVDLGLLRANSIYATNFEQNRIARLVRLAVRTRGWLIFYTHGVESSPDRWGCTPDQLESVLDSCLTAGVDVLSVAEGYSRIVSKLETQA